MDFQTPITAQSEAVKVLKAKAKYYRKLLQSPSMLMTNACIHFNTVEHLLTMDVLMEYKNILTIELNDFEKAIDLITKNTYD